MPASTLHPASHPLRVVGSKKALVQWPQEGPSRIYIQIECRYHFENARKILSRARESLSEGILHPLEDLILTTRYLNIGFFEITREIDMRKKDHSGIAGILIKIPICQPQANPFQNVYPYEVQIPLEERMGNTYLLKIFIRGTSMKT
jgi:hypothetical protein